MPQAHHTGPPIPFQLNLPPGNVPPLPTSQNDPFQIVNYNGQSLALTQQTAAALNSLPPLMPPLHLHGRGVSTPAASTVIFLFFFFIIILIIIYAEWSSTTSKYAKSGFLVSVFWV